MHILEQYSLNCGAKISKPYIIEDFFPLPFDEYITFHPKGKFSSREYDYWEEVLLSIHPILKKSNIQIVQVGGKDDKPYPFCYHTQGQTSFNNLAYIISNAKLHMGVDSFPIHLASYYRKPIVGLYCNMYPSQSGPYWSKEEEYSLLTPNLGTRKPSYAAQENPKTINMIPPEEITKAVINKLKINENINQKTIYFGESYHIKMIEIIPDHVPNLSNFNTDIANIRMDYFFNEEVLEKITSIYKSNILTDKKININLLKKIRPNIVSLYYIINDTKEFDVQFIKDLKNNGIRYALISTLEESKINKIKLETMDLGNIVIKSFEKNKEILDKLNLKNSRFKSGRILLSKGKVYPTLVDFKLNKNYLNNLYESFLLNYDSISEIYKELEHLYIFSLDN